MSKILLIEDDSDVQKIYGDTLRNAGYEVSVAKDGNASLQQIKTSKPDLILLDILLPGEIDGFGVLREMKKSDDLKNIPVIVLTNLESEKQIADSIGVTDYLVKANVSLEQIVKSVKRALKGR